MTERTVTETFERISKWPCWTYDLETTGLDPARRDVLIGAAIEGYDANGHDTDAFYLPFRHRLGANLSPERLPALMKMLGQRKEIRGWNVGFDARFSWNEGAPIELPIRDSMLDHHLLDENARSFQLKTIAYNMFGAQATAAERALDFELASILGSKGDMWRLDPSKVAPYACDDVSWCRAVADRHKPALQRENLEQVARGVSEYSRVVAYMMHRGVGVNLCVLGEAIVQAKKQATAALIEASQLAGRRVNLANAQAVCAWLGLSSSNDKILERMKDDPRVACVRKFRHAVKGFSSYYRKFRDMAPDGVLHADMLLFGTITGRMAVQNPPLQSLPTDTDEYRVKEAIEARPGYVLLQVDYQRAEMCMAAHYGHEERMLDILTRGLDVHSVVSEDLGISRYRAKRINFSIVYGIGAEALSQNLNISEAEAARYLKAYHQRYPGFRRLYNAAHDFAERHGYIVMWSGRRRHYNRGNATPTHKASSNLVQGSVNELMREAQTALDHELRRYDVHQVLQVHDAAVMEVPEEAVEEIAPRVLEIVEDHKRFRTPMRADIKYGRNMANTTEWKAAA